MFAKILLVALASTIGVLLLDRYLALCEPAVVQCDAGDVADEEAGTRLVEWLLKAKRQAKINEIEQMLEKRKGQV